MKSLKYLNCVLTVIAICLIILTFSAIGAFPKANASANSDNFVNSSLKQDKTTNTTPRSPDLIPFTGPNVIGEVYINKHSVTHINSKGGQSEIHLSNHDVIIVYDVAKNNAGKLNQ